MKALVSALILFPASLQAAQTVHIGLVSNFSEVSVSTSNPYGDYFRKGVKLALEDSKRKLDEKGIKVDLDEFDYGINQVRVLDAVKRAVASPVIGVLGYNYSSQALIAAPIHQQAKLPMLTPSATAGRVGRFGPYVHSACMDNAEMGRALAEVARSRLKAKSAAIVVSADCAYCQDLAKGFIDQFKSNGGTIAAQESVLESDNNFAKVVDNLKAKKFDVVLVPNYWLSSARVISSILKAGIQTTFLGGDGWGDYGQEFLELLSGLDFHGYSVSHWHNDLKTPRSLKFTKSYREKYKTQPNDTAVLAYDSMMLLIDALTSTKALTREGLEQALQQEREFEGATGKFRFRAGAAPSKSLVLLSAEHHKFKMDSVIDPPKEGAER